VCVHFPYAQDEFFPLYDASQKGYTEMMHRTVNAKQRISTGVVLGTRLHVYSTGYRTWQDPDIQCVLCSDPNTWFMQQLVTTLASIQATPTSSFFITCTLSLCEFSTGQVKYAQVPGVCKTLLGKSMADMHTST